MMKLCILPCDFTLKQDYVVRTFSCPLHFSYKFSQCYLLNDCGFSSVNLLFKKIIKTTKISRKFTKKKKKYIFLLAFQLIISFAFMGRTLQIFRYLIFSLNSVARFYFAFAFVCKVLYCIFILQIIMKSGKVKFTRIIA